MSLPSVKQTRALKTSTGHAKRPARPLKNNPFNRSSSFTRFLKSNPVTVKLHSDDPSDSDDGKEGEEGKEEEEEKEEEEKEEEEENVPTKCGRASHQKASKKKTTTRSRKVSVASSNEEKESLIFSDSDETTSNISTSKLKVKRRVEEFKDDDNNLEEPESRKRRSSSLTPSPELGKPQIAESLIRLQQPLLTISSIVTGSSLNPNEKDDNPVFGNNSSSGTTLVSSFEANAHAESHDLDPELQSIAAQAREHRHRREDSANGFEELASPSAPSWTTIRTSSNSSQGIGQKVEVKVRFVIDPRVVETVENQGHIKALKKVLKIIMMDNDPFEPLINTYCNSKNISKNELVLTYKKVKIFPRGTPASLGMVGKVDVEAYMKTTHNYILEQEELARLKELEELQSHAPYESSALDSSNRDVKDALGDVAEKGYLLLKLRSRDGKDEKLKVKKTTTVQAIITRYAKVKGLPPEASVRLHFEDEILKPEMQIMDTDLEDGDMLIVNVE